VVRLLFVEQRANECLNSGSWPCQYRSGGLGYGRLAPALFWRYYTRQMMIKSRPIARRKSKQLAQQAHDRIGRVREALATFQYLCSGTLSKRMKTCGKPSCACAHDPAARHGPYYEWSHMRAGRLLHRVISPEQAEILRVAIANYRKVKKLLRAWETQTERLIDSVSARER